MTNSIKMSGGFDIEIINAETGDVLKRLHIKNQLTEINRTIRTQMITGSYTGGLNALQIKYFAFGTDGAAASASQTKLGAEQFRKALTQQAANGGSVSSTVSLQTNEANFLIREIGIFCGPDASGTADSGTMLARTTVSIDKNDNLVINITRNDICEI